MEINSCKARIASLIEVSRATPRCEVREVYSLLNSETVVEGEIQGVAEKAKRRVEEIGYSASDTGKSEVTCRASYESNERGNCEEKERNCDGMQRRLATQSNASEEMEREKNIGGLRGHTQRAELRIDEVTMNRTEVGSREESESSDDRHTVNWEESSVKSGHVDGNLSGLEVMTHGQRAVPPSEATNSYTGREERRDYGLRMEKAINSELPASLTDLWERFMRNRKKRRNRDC